MRSKKMMILASFVAMVFALACENPPLEPAGPDATAPSLAKGGNGGGNGGGKPGGGSNVVTIDLSGGMVASEEPAVVVTDNKKKITVEGPTDCEGGVNCFNVGLALASLAGNPTTAGISTSGCVIDPPDMDGATLDRLIAHLDHPSEGRNWNATADKRAWTGTVSTSSWWSGGNNYSANLSTHPFLPSLEVAVDESPGDVFTFSGGSIRIKSPMSGNPAQDASLVCPNTGSITMTVNR